jgi:VanZ like family
MLPYAFLAPSFKVVKSDLVDAAVNIVGFIPFGLLVSAYLHRGVTFPSYQAILLTILVSGLTSLLIECLQAYLPTRTSSLPDVINNILGYNGWGDAPRYSTTETKGLLASIRLPKMYRIPAGNAAQAICLL